MSFRWSSGLCSSNNITTISYRYKSLFNTVCISSFGSYLSLRQCLCDVRSNVRKYIFNWLNIIRFFFSIWYSFCKLSIINLSKTNYNCFCYYWHYFVFSSSMSNIFFFLKFYDYLYLIKIIDFRSYFIIEKRQHS